MPGFKEKFYIHSRVIDPTTLYWKPFTDNELPNLKECLLRAGIDKSVSHTAEDDAKDIITLLRKYNFYCR
jgi:hypothetical protein